MSLSAPADVHVSFESLPAGAWTAGEDGLVSWVNVEFARFLGVAQAPLSDDDWARVAHPADFDAAMASWRRSVATRQPYEATLRLLSASTGRYRWHLSRAHRVSEAGAPARWVGLSIDIDDARRGIEQKHASIERLQAERERLRAVFANVPTAITVYVGDEHRIAMMNRASERLLGGRNLEGMALEDAFPEMREQGIVSLLDEVRATARPFEAREHRVEFDRLGDGVLQVGYFDFTLQPMTDEDGRVQSVLSCAVDVTAQVLAREHIERLAAEREAVLSQLNEGLIITDTAGHITFVNQRAHALHGVARLEVAPEDYTQAYSLLREDGSDYPTLELPLARAVREGVTLSGERWCIRRPDGSVVRVVGSARPVVAANGEALGAVLVMRQIDPD